MNNKSLMENVLELVQEKIRVDGGTDPVIFANTMDQEIYLMEASPLGNLQTKHRFYDLMKVFFAVYHVYEYVIASEAWTYTQKPGEKECRPSEHPDRREIVILTYVSREKQEVKMFTTSMVDGVKQLTPSNMLEGTTKWSGDFFSLLSLDPLPEKEARKARKEIEERFGVKFVKKTQNNDNIC